MSRAAVLAGIGAMVPTRVVSSGEVAALVGVDDGWIPKRTGIHSRHWADPGTCTSDLAVTAARRALESAGTDTADMVVVATSTPDRPMPATAPEVAARLGLGEVPSFDLSAACAGFVYGLSAGAGAIAAGLAERVVVIGADITSTRLNPHDRGTTIVFGDGAGAMVLRAGARDEPGALLGYDLGGDGTYADLLALPAGGSRQRAYRQPPQEEDNYIYMQGREIFAHAVKRMSQSTVALLERIGWAPESVDWFAAHQANVRILHALAEQLDVEQERLLVHLDRVGNTMAASIPLVLADAVARGRIHAGDRVLMTAFGGGLSWGSTALRWPAVPAVEPIPEST